MGALDLTIPREPPPNKGRASKAWLRALEATAPIARRPNRTLPCVIDELANVRGDAPALISDHEVLSYRALADRMNRYSRWALEQGIGKGDVVCLLMPNRPDYLAIWLGVTRVGGVVALLNTHLTGASLAHCISIVAPSHVIVAADRLEAFDTARSHFSVQPDIWVHGAHARDLPRIDLAVEQDRQTTDEAQPSDVGIGDLALYIYTSGTTGYPKAAKVSHHRLMQWSYWFAGMMDTKPDDRMYDCLPLYHSVGGVVAPGAVLVNGGAVVIRESFSASRFWDDVVRFDCTLFQYIGELCRYLLNAPPHPQEHAHRIRLCCGNGLRPDVWERFQNRFGIPHILEFYAATEGNFSLYNADGEPGAIGRIPPFLAHRFPAAIVRFDVETGEPLRDPSGFCIPCAPNEDGEAIGRIPAERADLSGRFEGYSSDHATTAKILHNVFEPGDAWFRTGDLMRKDQRGFFYFVDRVGDTFRWKGENVATSEVAEALTSWPGILEANVFGIALPHSDGRAGMAALVVDSRFELTGFSEHLGRRLPKYAHPVFLRILREMEVTTTFKHKKGDLAHAGFDPSTTPDAILFNHPERGEFVRLDAALYQRIQEGQVRL